MMQKNTVRPAMKEPLPAWLPWLLGAALSGALLVCLWLLSDIRFANNDDTHILRSFMSASPPTFHLYLHPLLCYPLSWLSAAQSGVPWFSWLQLFLLWLSGAVIVKSLMRCFWLNGRSPWLGLAAGAAFLAAYAMTYFARITYTVTAALLGAAAVLQIMGIDGYEDTNRQIVRGMALSLVLAALAYALRQMVAIPVLAFCAIAVLYKGLSEFGIGRGKRRAWKPLLAMTAVVAISFGLLAGLREWEISAKGMGEYMRWQRARISVMDYVGVNNLPPELLAELGWTEGERQLVDEWYFLDANISAEAFEKIEAYQRAGREQGLMKRLGQGVAQIGSFAQKEPLAMRSVWLLCGVWMLCGAGLMLWRRSVGLRWIILAAGVLLTGAMLVYLGMNGRLPLRAVLTAVLPSAALAFGLLPACLPGRHSVSRRSAGLPECQFNDRQPNDRPDCPLGCQSGNDQPGYQTTHHPARLNGIRRIALGGLACGCLALALWYAVPAAAALARPPVDQRTESDLTDAYADLDEYAQENPEYLVIYDSSMVGDLRMFPLAGENGLPSNLMYWGGWGARSPEYMARLASFGIDGERADASLFLREDVRLARGMLDPGPETLLVYLRERFGDGVDYLIDSEWGGTYVFQFYDMNE